MTETPVASSISFGILMEERPFDDVVDVVRDALAREGFGVLSTIDVAATLADRLDEFHTPYVILGACNPSLASWAIRADPSVGVLLPCNVVVRDAPDGVAVEFMDPAALLELIDDPDVAEVASQVRSRLARVREALAAA